MVQQAIPLSVIEGRLRAIEADIARLAAERDLLNNLRAHAVAVGTPESGAPRKVTLTDRVLLHIASYPGMTSSEIADNFISAGQDIGGSDPRKTIQTIIGALASKKRIEKREDGRLYPR